MNLSRTFEDELALRRRKQGYLGGSDAPKLFGFSDYGDALDVYHAKTRPIDPEEVRADAQEVSVDQYRGHAREREAIHLFLDDVGREGRHERRQIRAPGHPRVAVHVDGTIFRRDGFPRRGAEDPFDGTGVAEVKAPRVSGFRRLLEEGVPTRYTIQAQFNAAVAERDWCALIFYNDQVSEGPIQYARVPADPELGRRMLDRAQLFMEHHVRNRIPPDPDRWDLSEETDADEILLDRETDYRDVEDPEFVDGIAGPLIEVQRAYKEAKDRRSDLRKQTREWLEENEETDAARLPDGSKVRIIRREGRVRLQEDKLREHRPIDRDALERAIREGAILVDDPAALGLAGVEDDSYDRMVEAVLEELELDFERFERKGSPSAYVNVYPSKQE